MHNHDNGNNIRLRHTFVAMLFALVAGQIALTTVDVFQLFQNETIHTYNLLAAVSHLILVIVILTTSWVGWSMSVVKNDEALQLTNVFSRPYIILLIDMVLVITYFAMVKMVEIDDSWFLTDAQSNSNQIGSFGKKVMLGLPSAAEEILILKLIFALYFVWDIIHDTKVCAFTANSHMLIKVIGNSVVRGRISGLLFLLVFIVSSIFESKEQPNDLLIVVLCDTALLSLVLIFRAIKIIEKVKMSEITDQVIVCVTWLVLCVYIYIMLILAMASSQIFR